MHCRPEFSQCLSTPSSGSKALTEKWFIYISLCQEPISPKHLPQCAPSLLRDGRSRQFGFVGFQSIDQAGDAIHYFYKSYIDTSRLQVKVGPLIPANIHAAYSMDQEWTGNVLLLGTL